MFVINCLKLGLFLLGMFVTLALVNISLALSFIFYPFSRRLYHRLSSHFTTLWMIFCFAVLEKYFRFKFVLRTPDLSTINKAVLIGNHQTFFDVVALYRLAVPFGSGRNLKWFAKNSFKHLPMLGWGLYLSHHLFLHRDWAQDQRQMQRTFSYLLAINCPFWVSFFPEGTRLTAAKLRSSQEYARQKHYPVLNKVLLPRPKGFITTVNTLREHVEAVIDTTLCYQPVLPTIPNILRGMDTTVIIHCEVIPLSTLPSSDQELKQWLLKRYEEKDQLLSDPALSH